MDGLSIITGIALVVFILFYLAFNLEKEHIFLKVLLIFSGLFMLVFIPQTTIELDRDCGILSNGTYLCYTSNGTQITDYEGGSSVGINFTNSYLWVLRIFAAYLLITFLILF